MKLPTRYRARHSQRGVLTASTVGLGRPRVRLATVLAAAALVLVALATLVATGTIDLVGTGSPGPVANPADRASDPGRSSAAEPIPHRLKITTHPPRARLRIKSDGEVIEKGKTPFKGMIPGGDATLVLVRAGFNRLTERVELDRDRSLELWLDPKGLLHHQIAAFATEGAPKQVAFTPDGEEIWVTLLGGEGVQVFDSVTGRLLDTIDLGRFGGVEVIFSEDGSTAYVSQMETASVLEIDVRTHDVLRRLRTESAWSKVMALSPDERTLYVANWSGDNVTEIGLRRGKVRRQIPTVDTPRGLYVTPDGGRLFVAGYADGEIQRVDLETGRSRVLLRTGGAMRHLVGDAAQGVLYADDMATDEVYTVDLDTERIRKLAETDHMPNTIDLTPDGRVLYVSNRGANNPESYYLPGPEWGSVLAIDTATGDVLDAIVGGDQTTGLDVSPDGRMLAYSDFLDNHVSVFAIPSYDVLAEGDGGRWKAHLEEIEKS
jgi:DNA-binding beta-propeller fold protein YncE